MEARCYLNRHLNGECVFVYIIHIIQRYSQSKGGKDMDEVTNPQVELERFFSVRSCRIDMADNRHRAKVPVNSGWTTSSDD